MPNIAGVLKEEIARISRKVIKSDMESTRRASVQYRKDISVLKRQVTALERELRSLRGKKAKVADTRAAEEDADADTKGMRFSAKGVKSHRTKLGLSAADYGRLVGVSGLTIYNWEGGKSKPRAAQLVSLAAVRGMGKRQALKRLEETAN